MLTVVAALIEGDGKLLVCQRRRGGPFELMWEFPGGKIQAGETLEAALARELREELGVDAEIGREIYRTRHEYKKPSNRNAATADGGSIDVGRLDANTGAIDMGGVDRRDGDGHGVSDSGVGEAAAASESIGKIELIFFAATADAGAMRNLVFEQIQWRAPETLLELNFLPADRELIGLLASGALRL